MIRSDINLVTSLMKKSHEDRGFVNLDNRIFKYTHIHDRAYLSVHDDDSYTHSLMKLVSGTVITYLCVLGVIDNKSVVYVKPTRID